jgi:hypothetical protein
MEMVKVVIGTIGILGLASCNYAVADSPCDYVKDVQTNWTQQIEKTSNIDRKVFPYVEDTRKCMMTMDVTINGQTYPAEGSYVFGPDMSENDACDNATVNAKKSVISEVSPEILSAKTEMNCSIQDKPVVAEAPTETVTIQESTPVIQEGTPVVTERVISRKLVDSSTNNVVSYIPSSKKTITIGGFTIGFADGRTPGKCYANWVTGGTDCY